MALPMPQNTVVTQAVPQPAGLKGAVEIVLALNNT